MREACTVLSWVAGQTEDRVCEVLVVSSQQ